MRVHAELRRYQGEDEAAWLRCRVLSFLDSDYYDDVKTRKTVLAPGSVELVATADGEVVALLDVEVNGDAATIDSVACHPDHRRSGLAAQLLAQALASAELSSVRTVDAWTRENASAHAWYEHCGFTERFRYLHVYASGDDLPSFLGLPVVQAFLHAPIEQEADLRARHTRVYTCRQYVLEL